MRLSHLLYGILLMLSTIATMPAATQKVVLGDIKKSLVCLCDCSMTVEACQGSMACTSADNLTMEAQQYVEQGMNKEAILAAFISKYGEYILAAPTKHGFNLTAWVLPFALIILAGLVIVGVLRYWVRGAKLQTGGTHPDSTTESIRTSRHEQELDQALKYLD